MPSCGPQLPCDSGWCWKLIGSQLEFGGQERRKGWLVACFALLAIWLVTYVPAQPPPGNSDNLPDRVPSALEKGVVKPDAFYLRDTSGNYIFVPNLRYEEFERLLRSQKPLLDPQLPTYQVVDWQIAGEVQGELVRWQVDIQVRLSSAANGAIAIPLGLTGWHLTAMPRFEGEGEHLLELISSNAGYQWWVRGTGESLHRIQLSMVSNLASVGDRISVRTSLPAMPSTIRLVVNGQDVDPKVEGQGGETLTSRNLDNGKSEILLRTNGGNQSILWQPLGDRTRLFSVECQSNTRIEIAGSATAWRCKSVFKVQSSGPTLPKEFMITLPKGAQWLGATSTGTDSFRIEPVVRSNPNVPDSASKAEMPTVDRQVLRCTTTTTASTLEIPVDWSTPSPLATEGGNVSVESPRIDSIDRHEGVIELSYPSTFRVFALANSSTFPIATENRTPGNDQAIARFRFEQQPGSLQLSIRPEFSEIRLRPTYVVGVYKDRLELKGSLDIAFARGQSTSVNLNTASWSILDAKQATTGSPLVLQAEPNSRVRIEPPNTSASPDNLRDTARNVIWSIAGTRELTGERSLNLEVNLPSLAKDLAAPPNSFVDYGAGILILIPADNVLLRQDESLSAGLIADSEIPQEVLDTIPTEQRRRAVAYRFQASATAPKWLGSREMLPQQITADSDVNVEISPVLSTVVQTWKLQIENEPLNPLRFVVNRSLFSKQAMIATINGSAVPLVEVPTDVNAPPSEAVLNPELAIVELSQPVDLLGETILTVDTKIPLQLPTEKPTDLDLPLVQIMLPPNTGYLQSSLRAVHTADLSVPSIQARVRGEKEQREIGWSTVSQDVSLQVDPALENLRLSIKRLTMSSVPAVRMTKSWLQTAFNAAQRRDRFAFAVETTNRRLSLKFNEADLPNVYDVLVDGQRIEFSMDQEKQTLFIDLPPDLTAGSHCVEIWSEAGRSVAGVPVNLSLPKVEGATGPQQFYWELILPESEHLVVPPSELTPEWQWMWKTLGWYRQSRWTQTDLEKWIGASDQTTLPNHLNRYVMSTFGFQQQIQFMTLPKPWIWLPVGGLVILLTLVWSSIRWSRHPICLSILLVLVGVLAIYLPDAAMMAMQLSLLAISLSIVFALTRWAIGRRVRRRSVFTSYPTNSSNAYRGTGTSPTAPQMQDRSVPAASINSAAPHGGTATVTSPGSMVEP